MSTPTIPGLGGCGRPASGRIEVHSPAGSFVAVAYACGEHVRAFLTALAAAGLVGHVDPDPTAARDMARPCGHVFLYDPPAPSSTVVTLPSAGELRHPTWCGALLDDTCAKREYHATDWTQLAALVDGAPLVEVQLFQDTAGSPVRLALRFTSDEKVSEQFLPLGQAAQLVFAISTLVERGGR